jgi:hypothetical protein
MEFEWKQAKQPNPSKEEGGEEPIVRQQGVSVFIQ